jgi:hypothetical protein
LRVAEFDFLPLAEILSPPPGVMARAQVYRSFHWLVDAEGRVALWDWYAPQANMDRRIVERALAKYEWAVAIVHLPLAYLPLREDRT